MVTTLTLENGRISATEREETYGAEKNKLIPTDIGMVVNRFLTEYFPSILDYNFTAKVEEKFDEIAEGKLAWASEMKDFYDGFHPDVERALNMRLEHKVGERQLGVTADGEPVSVKIGRFGPLVQIGVNEGETKPRFASLLKGQSVDSITLAEALKLFEFPKTLGDYEGKTVTIGIGKFGPYIRHDGKYVSLPKDYAPAHVTLDEATALIEAKREAERKKVVKTFDDEPELQILNGRYGVYIAYKGENYKIPKTVSDPTALTAEEVMEIVNNQEVKPKRTARRSATTRGKK